MNKELEDKSAVNIAEALAKPINGEGEAKAGPEVAQRIVITLYANGQLQLEGPLQDQVLMYGLIEMAKAAFTDQLRQTQARRVQVPPPGLINKLMKHAGIGKGH